ncbi:MAG: hypothetical protein AB7F43_14170 [Bacteriovoracia bacterium]
MVLTEFLPKGFDFYGQGLVESIRSDDFGVEQYPFAAAFELVGDETGMCIIAFSAIPEDFDGPNESMAVEMANILVSKFSYLLSEASGGLTEVSPPKLFREQDTGLAVLLATVNNPRIYRFSDTYLKVWFVRKEAANA